MACCITDTHVCPMKSSIRNIARPKGTSLLPLAYYLTSVFETARSLESPECKCLRSCLAAALGLRSSVKTSTELACEFRSPKLQGSMSSVRVEMFFWRDIGERLVDFALEAGDAGDVLGLLEYLTALLTHNKAARMAEHLVHTNGAHNILVDIREKCRQLWLSQLAIRLAPVLCRPLEDLQSLAALVQAAEDLLSPIAMRPASLSFDRAILLALRGRLEFATPPIVLGGVPNDLIHLHRRLPADDLQAILTTVKLLSAGDAKAKVMVSLVRDILDWDSDTESQSVQVAKKLSELLPNLQDHLLLHSNRDVKRSGEPRPLSSQSTGPGQSISPIPEEETEEHILPLGVGLIGSTTKPEFYDISDESGSQLSPVGGTRDLPCSRQLQEHEISASPLRTFDAVETNGRSDNFATARTKETSISPPICPTLEKESHTARPNQEQIPSQLPTQDHSFRSSRRAVSSPANSLCGHPGLTCKTSTTREVPDQPHPAMSASSASNPQPTSSVASPRSFEESCPYSSTIRRYEAATSIPSEPEEIIYYKTTRASRLRQEFVLAKIRMAPKRSPRTFYRSPQPFWIR